MGEPLRKRLRRRDVPGTARFLTFSGCRRLCLFDDDAIKDRFVEQLGLAAGRHAVAVLAWVVVPEHVHRTIDREGGDPVGTFLQTLKDPFAREILRHWRERDTPILQRMRDKAGSAHFWQAGGGQDCNVVGAELIEKIRYVHANPIRRGLSPDCGVAVVERRGLSRTARRGRTANCV